MNTTELFLELLLIGTGCIVWALTFVFIYIDPHFLDYMIVFNKESSALFILLGVGLSYVVGIIIDRAYVFIWCGQERIIQKKNGIESLAKYNEFQMDSGKHNHELFRTQLNFYTSRMRILRGSMINLFLLGIIAFPYSYEIAFFCFLANLVTTYSWFNLTNKYYSKIGPLVNTDNELSKFTRKSQESISPPGEGSSCRSLAI